MTDKDGQYLLYGELAAWWPLISPPEEYADEAEFAASVLNSASIPVNDVLELGSGGGNNARYLKRHFTMTLVDLSPAMLAVSRRLNPECAHHQGDMRSLRLGRHYDAVFVHDAVDYMLSERDLGSVVQTAFDHCRPGGVAVLIPDHTVETFEETTEHGGGDDPSGPAARYLAWSWDPDPADSWIQTEYAFVLREADGGSRVVHETHRTGLFTRETWLRLLAESGFDAFILAEQTTEDRAPRSVFVGHRPVIKH